ncbi:DUF378 domain-containing protein [Oceanobacillus luteolus]|uniref:DUF378 domain-containing protein n=1 Tax=Oceanobacillus luteolus TaxID=1274358 RepID=A0ABW4HMG5_9BACI|nr:DUF378 domain-containing protein [Oceanobacillus luteolus]MCM3740756.1 DUF378 domain-containing protein [Oceanobacillus luteolus]
METLRRIALTLVIIGAINWGLIALFQFDLVASIFGGQDAALSRLIYGLVGLSGLICLSFFFEPDVATSSDRVRATNQTSFGTEFADDFDPEYRLDRDKQDNNRDQNP